MVIKNQSRLIDKTRSSGKEFGLHIGCLSQMVFKATKNLQGLSFLRTH